MADQVEEIKQKTDIVSLVNEFVPLKKAGRNFKAPCPFHSEKIPSFMVSPELQIFKCFGCNEGGDSIAFLQKHEGMEFYEALKFLADRAGVELKPISGRQISDNEHLIEANNLAARFYNYVLINHPAGKVGLEYLTNQRKVGRKTIDEFMLGFAPENPQALTKFLTEKKRIDISVLEKAGLVVKTNRGVVDRFRARAIFPIFDHRGRAIALAGRILPKAPNSLAKYINSPDSPVYHKSNSLYGINVTKGDIKKARKAVIVEGELDLLSSWQAGVKNVVAIKGSALTEGQVIILSRFCDEVIWAPDSDVAGSRAAVRGIAEAQKAGLEIRVAEMSEEHKDPDEFARADPKNYKKAIKKAVPAWNYVINSIFSKYKNVASSTSQISREVVPVLVSIGDKIVQARYIRLVSRRLGVPVEAVSEEVVAFINKQKIQKSEPAVPATASQEKSRRQVLEEQFLALSLRVEPSKLLKKESVALFSTPLLSKVVKHLATFNKGKKKFNLLAFRNSLPGELSEGFSEILLKVSDNELASDERELLLVKQELATMVVKQQLKELTKTISEFEKSRNRKKLAQAKRKFSRLSEQLSRLNEGKPF